MKRVTPIDGPINGYVDRHSDGEYVGIFKLTPGSLKLRNRRPTVERVQYITEFDNRVDECGPDFWLYC